MPAETPKTIVIDFKGTEPDQTFTNCTLIEELTNPARLRFHGTKDGDTATWTFSTENNSNILNWRRS